MSTLATFFITLGIFLSLATLLGVALIHARIERTRANQRDDSEREALKAARVPFGIDLSV